MKLKLTGKKEENTWGKGTIEHKKVTSEITKAVCNLMTIAWCAKAGKEKDKKNTTMLQEKGAPTLSTSIESPVLPL